ncbi:MAG: oxidoreductase, short chain dehydrogenase/reductase family protein [Frankiales bacterium]|nr:oxidoreductase, short chain dehydrogenase/reductase family protein [Frankiales bacterium]
MAVAARTEQVWDERLPGTIGDTLAAIEDAGGKAVAIRADVMDPDDRRNLVLRAQDALGPVTVLINNAAFTAPGRPPAAGEATRPPRVAAPGQDERPQWPGFVSTPLSAFRRHFDVGVFAAYELMQLVVPGMTAAGGGAIINITSAASRMPGDGPYADRTDPTLPGYGGAKAALEHLTQCAAYDLQPSGISVTALSPSQAIMTPGVAYYAKDFDELGSAEDFAEAAVRLSLVDADQVTGRTIGHLDVLNGSFRAFAP